MRFDKEISKEKSTANNPTESGWYVCSVRISSVTHYNEEDRARPVDYVIADYDRRQNVSKLADGRRRSALSGKRAGVDPGYGYAFNEENKRVIVPEEAAVIRKIYRMQRSRMRQSDIANALNEAGLTR